MKKILLIQYRTDISRNHEMECFLTFGKFGKAEIDIINIFDKVPWSHPEKVLEGYDGLILGGSGEFYLSEKPRGALVQKAVDNTIPMIDHMLATDFPLLAICFGHQLLGEMLGNEVVEDARYAKTGSFWVRKHVDAVTDPIFDNVSDEFIGQYAHKNTLVTAPKGVKPLCSGEQCPVSGYKYKNNIYSFQFHPELNEKSMVIRMNLYRTYVKGSVEEFIKQLKPSPDASRILENFITYVVRKKSSIDEFTSPTVLEAKN